MIGEHTDTFSMMKNMLLKFAFRLSAVYLGIWVLALLTIPELVIHAIYKAEISPLIQSLMNHNIFLRMPLVVLCWYFPVIANRETQQHLGFYAGIFWLFTSLVTLSGVTFGEQFAGPIAFFRLPIETGLGLLLLYAARNRSMR